MDITNIFFKITIHTVFRWFRLLQITWNNWNCKPKHHLKLSPCLSYKVIFETLWMPVIGPKSCYNIFCYREMISNNWTFHLPSTPSMFSCPICTDISILHCILHWVAMTLFGAFSTNIVCLWLHLDQSNLELSRVGWQPDGTHICFFGGQESGDTSAVCVCFAWDINRGRKVLNGSWSVVFTRKGEMWPLTLQNGNFELRVFRISCYSDYMWQL